MRRVPWRACAQWVVTWRDQKAAEVRACRSEAQACLETRWSWMMLMASRASKMMLALDLIVKAGRTRAGSAID